MLLAGADNPRYTRASAGLTTLAEAASVRCATTANAIDQWNHAILSHLTVDSPRARDPRRVDADDRGHEHAQHVLAVLAEESPNTDSIALLNLNGTSAEQQPRRPRH